MTNLEIIRTIDLLQPLEDDQIIEISNRFVEQSFPKGTILFEENEQGDSFYIVKSGEVTLSKRLKVAENETGIITTFHPYEYFGELALIDEEPRSGTATITEDSCLLKISKEHFLDICQDYPQIMFGIIRTISYRLRKTNDRYIEMWDELIIKSKLAAIGTAVGKIVHDIKTPITIIVLTAQMIARISKESGKFTDKIVKQVTVLDEMVREILEFARGEKSELKVEKISLQKFLNDLEESIKPIADSERVELIIASDSDAIINIDSFKVSRTITNLFKNSIEALKGNPGRIEICTTVKESKLLLSVSDNGPGIPEDLLSSIFEPFVTHGKKAGTGLGLAICQKVIHDHRGEIYVCNRKEGGARFDIHLPLEV